MEINIYLKQSRLRLGNFSCSARALERKTFSTSHSRSRAHAFGFNGFISNSFTYHAKHRMNPHFHGINSQRSGVFLLSAIATTISQKKITKCTIFQMFFSVIECFLFDFSFHTLAKNQRFVCLSLFYKFLSLFIENNYEDDNVMFDDEEVAFRSFFRSSCCSVTGSKFAMIPILNAKHLDETHISSKVISFRSCAWTQTDSPRLFLSVVCVRCAGARPCECQAIIAASRAHTSSADQVLAAALRWSRKLFVFAASTRCSSRGELSARRSAQHKHIHADSNPQLMRLRWYLEDQTEYCYGRWRGAKESGEQNVSTGSRLTFSSSNLFIISNDVRRRTALGVSARVRVAREPSAHSPSDGRSRAEVQIGMIWYMSAADVWLRVRNASR